MLTSARIGAIVPVSDIERGIEFYGKTLGLGTPERDGSPQNPGARFDVGGGELYIYESVGAGESRHTLAAFEVDALEQEMGELRGRGVTFEEYENTTDGVMEIGPQKVAFFKDADGNILGLGQRVRVGAAV